MEPLKALVIKISELYDKLFRTWTRAIAILVLWLIALWVLPVSVIQSKTALIIGWAFTIFVFIGIIGRAFRKKDSGKS